MDRRGQGRNARVTRRLQRLGGVAKGAEDGLAIRSYAAVEAGGVVAVGRQCARVSRSVLRELVLIVQAQDVEPVVALRQPVPGPAGRRRGSGLRAGGMAGPAIHLVGHGQDDVVSGDRLIGTVPGNHAHDRVGVLLPRIVEGCDGNALGVKPVNGREDAVHRLVKGLEKVGLADIGRPRHRPTGKPRIHRERSIQERRVGVKVAFAGGSGVDGARPVCDRLVGHRIAGPVGDQLPPDNELGLKGVVGRQDGEDRVIAIHAMHAKVVPAENSGAGGAGGERKPTEQAAQHGPNNSIRRTQVPLLAPIWL